MRNPLVLLALAVVALVPNLAHAQPTKIEKVRVGFRPYNEAANFGRYKIGLWTPVYVEITAGDKGLGQRGESPYVQIETQDFEDVGTIYRVPVPVLEPGETRMVIAYTKSGNANGEVRVTLHVGNRTINPPGDRDMAMNLQGHVYLALGRRVADLPAALSNKKDNDKREDFQFQDEGRQRAALFEDKVDMLPAHWFGYDGVDMIFLSTDSTEFLTKLANKEHVDHLRAIVQWVRRGGRLIVPVSKHNQAELNKLLTKEVWQPPIPVVPPSQKNEKFVAPERLTGVETWANVQVPLPAPGEKAPLVAQLEPADVAPGDWEVEAPIGAGGVPLIARVKYGMGQIVYFAFSFDDPAVTQWPGRVEFLRKVIAKLAPLTGQDINNNQANPNFNFRGQQNATDVTSQLYNALDNFDVRVIPFGIVAAFIVLYVVIVGPLEFVLLKYVFGRLEWTWITFPTVVLGVSVIAYFGAYALKGQDLKVNKVDIVDFDLRTHVDARTGQPRSVRIYGQSFLTILSPRIQSYTVGVEPNPAFWGGENPAKPLSADVVSWMARPDNGPGGMGRGSGQGFFRKPYYYGTPSDPPHEESLPSGVTGVPIPVWMAKAFSASWEASASAPPLVADLVYHRNPVDGKEIKVSGTLRSNLGVDLSDAWLFYADRCYQIENGIAAGKDKAAVKISLDHRNQRTPADWSSDNSGGVQRLNTSQGLYDPSGIVRQMLFFDQLDQQHTLSNHSLRRLDQSWRLYKEPTRDLVDRRTREAILVARVAFVHGPAEELTRNASSPLPTNIWLGSLPETGGMRPELVGNLNQDTYVRMILPVRPAGN
jgi:hypothetical protein